MSTNSIPELNTYIDKLIKISDGLLGLPALPLVFIGCLAWGYLLAAVPKYKNAWIPAGVFAFGIVANLLVTPMRNVVDVGRAIIIGMIAGGASWWFHKKIMSRWIADDAFKNGDTTRTEKPEEPPKP